MKKEQIILIGAIILAIYSINAAAYDYPLSDALVGKSYNWRYYDIPEQNYSSGTDDSLQFLLQNPGTSTIELKYSSTGNGVGPFYCESLDFDKTTRGKTWTRVYTNYNKTNSTFPTAGYANITDRFITATFNISSNAGIFRCVNDMGATKDAQFYTESSYVTVITANYTSRNFTAGQGTFIPLLNFYHNQSGTAGSQSTAITLFGDVVAYATNNSVSYDARIYPICETTEGVKTFAIHNSNATGTGEQTKYYNGYVTAVPDLNISYKYPNSPLSYDTNVIVNFTVATENEASVQYIAWYVNGGLMQYSSTLYTYSQSFPIAGTYNVTVKLVDNSCQRYPTTEWTVIIGTQIILEGTVYDNITYSPLSGVTVSVNKSGYYSSTQTNAAGYYNLTGLNAGLYTITFSKLGYNSNSTIKNMAAGYTSPTTYQENAYLQTTNATGAWDIFVYDAETYIPITSYNLILYLGGEQVLTITTGTVTSTKYGINATVSNEITSITNLPLENTYTVSATKAGYNTDTDTETITASDLYAVDYLYLTGITNYTASANFSNLQPTTTSTINITLNTAIQINATLNTSQNDFTVCLYVRRYGYSYGSGDCYPYTVSGTNIKVSRIYELLTDQTYYYRFKATTGSQIFTSAENVFYTIGTPATTTTHITLATTTTTRPLKTTTTTTTTTTTSTTTTTMPTGTPTEITYNCTNLTGKLYEGDIFHCAVCPFILILGGSIFYGLTLILILITVYKATDNAIATGIIGLLYTSLFLTVLPQPTINYLSVGVGLSIAFTLYGIYRSQT